MIALAYSMGGLGAISASAPVEVALRHFSWREIFTAFGAAALALCLVFALVVPEHPKARRPPGLREGLRGLSRLAADAAFWRVAVAIGTNQCAVVSLFTLWITTWLRDVAGYDRAGAAQGLAVRGGRDDRRISASSAGWPTGSPGAGAPSCRSSPPAWSAASAASRSSPSASTGAAVLLWAGFVFCGTSATLAHSIVTRRYPRDMAGRVNTALNTFTFLGIFLGQWGTGACWASGRRPLAGYDPRGYSCALGALWLVQLAGLAWLWRGRALLDK